MSGKKSLAVVGGATVLTGLLSLVLAGKPPDRSESQDPESPQDSSAALFSQGAVTWGALELLAGRGEGLLGESELERQIREDMVLRQRIVSGYRSEHPELKRAQDEVVMNAYLSQMVILEAEITEGEIRRYYSDNPDIYSGYPYRRVRPLIKTKLTLRRYLSQISRE